MNKKLADLMFPDIAIVTDEIFKRYPLRQLPEGAMVTRIAPSPTGYLHIGTLYAAFISWRLARQSKGIFYIRLEDTDEKREVKGAAESLIKELNAYGITADEGCWQDGSETGSYGPYMQSERRIIYQAFVKELISRGLAYPCFCDKTELDYTRSLQKEKKLNVGYYDDWAKCRLLSFEEIKQKIDSGVPYVIRIKAVFSDEKIIYDDLFKGRLVFATEYKDTIILKTDGLPTYHFAHCIDDTLMRTTHVLRGDEWISSLPTHRQLFQSVGFNQPIYGHIAPIVKVEGTTKRKYSKRKDLDGLASYFLRLGYPVDGLHEYFLTLANSAFETWRIKNPYADIYDYKIDITNFSASGAVLDKNKLYDVCKNVVAICSVNKIFDLIYNWAEQYDKELFDLMQDREYIKAILAIGRNQAKPRKDIGIFSEVKNVYAYFFDSLFEADSQNTLGLDSVTSEATIQFLTGYLSTYDQLDEKDTWFCKLKTAAANAGFCVDMKEYKKNKEAYQGSVSDAATLLRIALTHRPDSPDLYDIQQVMGKERVKQRISKYLSNLEEHK